MFEALPVGEEDEGEGLVEGDALPGRVLAAEPPSERGLDQRLAVRLLYLREHVEVLVETPGSKHTSEISRSKMSMYKFALLWGEAQLCLPYVCLQKNIAYSYPKVT